MTLREFITATRIDAWKLRIVVWNTKTCCSGQILNINDESSDDLNDFIEDARLVNYLDYKVSSIGYDTDRMLIELIEPNTLPQEKVMALESRIGDSNDPYEIRIFWDEEGEYIDDADYLTGLSDVKVRAFYHTADDLVRGWYELLKTNEGDTYCVLDHGSPIVSGVYDPSDYEFLFLSLYNLDLSIPVCVYASSTGLYTPDECDYDNLTSITFPTAIVWKWYNENVLPAYEPDAPEADFITWYKEEYTADDTDELYWFAVDHGFTGKRPDGFERKDVELAETIVDHVDSATPWWDKLDVDAVLQMLSTTEGCKHIINELLCHIDLGTKVDLPLRKED